MAKRKAPTPEQERKRERRAVAADVRKARADLAAVRQAAQGDAFLDDVKVLTSGARNAREAYLAAAERHGFSPSDGTLAGFDEAIARGESIRDARARQLDELVMMAADVVVATERTLAVVDAAPPLPTANPAASRISAVWARLHLVAEWCTQRAEWVAEAGAGGELSAEDAATLASLEQRAEALWAAHVGSKPGKSRTAGITEFVCAVDAASRVPPEQRWRAFVERFAWNMRVYEAWPDRETIAGACDAWASLRPTEAWAAVALAIEQCGLSAGARVSGRQLMKDCSRRARGVVPLRS